MIRKVLETMYRSPIGFIMSWIARLLTFCHRPHMIYGYYNKQKKHFNKFTRISDTSLLISSDKIDIADNVWVWHYTILDGTNHLTINEGTQIGAWVGIFTHSSHVSIRLHGKEYPHIHSNDRIGYVRKPVEIGPYCFIGASSIILPGVSLGKGCVVTAMSVVTESAPDYSLLEGNPAKIIGDTRKLDVRYFKHKEIQRTYVDQEYLSERSGKKGNMEC